MRRLQFSSKPFAVRPHNPRTRTIVSALLALIVITAVSGAYFFGQYRGGYQRWIVQARHERLKRERDALATTNADLRQQMVFLKRSRKIDEGARKQVQEANTKLQGSIVALKKKLRFYNDIVAPGAVHSGVRVQALDVVPGHKPGHFHYSLVLMRGPRHNRATTGKVKVTVVGTPDSRKVTLDRAFKFRYFENLRGGLRIPAGFTPHEIDVTVSEKGRRGKPYQRKFDWHVQS